MNSYFYIYMQDGALRRCESAPNDRRIAAGEEGKDLTVRRRRNSKQRRSSVAAALQRSSGKRFADEEVGARKMRKRNS